MSRTQDILFLNAVPTPREHMLLAGKPLPTAMQGVAPIFGRDICCFIAGDAHIRLPRASFGSNLFGGFSLAVDIQPEGTNPSVLMGTGVSGRTSLIIHYNEGGVKNRIRVDIQDDNGRSLSARAQLSQFAAKRLLITVDVKDNNITFSEFNIRSTTKAIPVEYLARESPNKFSEYSYDMMVGGACIDGSRRGSISTKVNHLILFANQLSEQDIDQLFRASQQSLVNFYGIHAYDVDESEERRFVFRDDLRKIRDLLYKHEGFSGADTRESGNILYRWLFDTHPLLQDLCNELGVQLTFPGMNNERAEPYRDADLMRKALFGITVTLGKESIRGYQWVPLYRFAKDPILAIKGTVVRIKEFVTYVNQKAGGKHFDPHDRRKWQRELAEMTRYWKAEEDFFNAQMRELLGAVYEAIVEDRIEEHATLNGFRRG